MSSLLCAYPFRILHGSSSQALSHEPITWAEALIVIESHSKAITDAVERAFVEFGGKVEPLSRPTSPRWYRAECRAGDGPEHQAGPSGPRRLPNANLIEEYHSAGGAHGLNAKAFSTIEVPKERRGFTSWAWRPGAAAPTPCRW